MRAEVRPIGIVGNFNADLVAGPVPHMPAWDEEVVAGGANLWTAGTAGYMALAASSLCLEPRIISAIGDDQTGAALLSDLTRRGIPTDGIAVLPGERTPMGIVVVGQEGRRGIISFNGAHDRLDLAVYRSRERVLADCAEVVICGSYLLPRLGPAEAVQIARDARNRGQLVVFDPSWDPAGWPDDTRRATFDLLGLVDLYLPNEAELLGLTGAASWEAGLEAVAQYCPEVVVKRGGAGATAQAGGVRTERAALPVTAADTIGAGDSFDIAYLWARRRGWPMERRLDFANAYAGVVVSSSNRNAFPDQQAALRRMRDMVKE